MLSVWIYTSELSNTMNTILLNAEDIKIGFRCLAELLLEGMKELDENQWFELGVCRY